MRLIALGLVLLTPLVEQAGVFTAKAELPTAGRIYEVERIQVVLTSRAIAHISYAIYLAPDSRRAVRGFFPSGEATFPLSPRRTCNGKEEAKPER